MKISLIDLKAQYNIIQEEIEKNVLNVLRSQKYILGTFVQEFEESCKKFFNAYCLGVSSGTDAILMSLMALGIGSGDEVITTDYTFFSTAGCIARVGAKPVFIDINLDSYNIDVNKIEEKITSHTKAIIPVHLYGQSCEMDKILEIAKKYNIYIIEDGAQSFGAYYKDNLIGTLGTTGCFSFYPSKNLGGIGDGGLIVTKDKDLFEKLKRIRVHGETPNIKYHYEIIGGNFRLDAIQAAALNVKLKYIKEWNKKRKEKAETYINLFKEKSLDKYIKFPYEQKNSTHIYNQFIIFLENKITRDKLKNFLLKNEISTTIYYPIPLHRQPCFSYLNYMDDDFINSIKASECTLALPIYPEITIEQQNYIVKVIEKFFKS